MLCTRSTISQWDENEKLVQKLVKFRLQIATVNLDNYDMIVQQGLEIHGLYIGAGTLQIHGFNWVQNQLRSR